MNPTDAGSPASTEAANDILDSLAGDGAAYRKSLVQDMSDAQSSLAQRIENVKNTHIRTGRDKYLANLFDQFFLHGMTGKAGCHEDGRVLFITGESGVGKSHAIRHMLKTRPSLRPRETPIGAMRPAISVTLQGTETLKTLGVDILTAAGYPLERTKRQGELWSILPNQLKLRGVVLVHIDETQHMLRQTEKDRHRRDLANTVKGVMNDPNWPINFILSGLPRTTDLAKLDEQFERRAMFVQLPSLDIQKNRKLVVKAIIELAAAAELDATEIVTSDVPDRAARAANFRFGRIITLIINAIEVALLKSSETLEKVHFAEAYVQVSHAQGHNDMNFFIADNWDKLKPGSFLKG